MKEDDGLPDKIVFRNILKESTIDDMYGDIDSQDNSSCASDKSWGMAKDGGQEDQKNIVHNDAVDSDEINDLNEDGLHLHNGLGNNVNNGNNKHYYIKQGEIINEQGTHFGNVNNNQQAQNKYFGGANELNQNNINDDDKDNDKDNDNDNDNDNEKSKSSQEEQPSRNIRR